MIRTLLTLSFVSLAAHLQGEPADLVLRNGRIVTVDDARPEAQALAARGGVIVAVGSDEEIRSFIGSSTRVIDLAGALAVPGFIEGHGHFMGIGEAEMRLKLGAARSWGEIVSAVKDAAEESEPGVWIEGGGWHQEKWDSVPEGSVDGVPNHRELTKVSPENPVVLEHVSGHGVFVNQKAMDAIEYRPQHPGSSRGNHREGRRRKSHGVSAGARAGVGEGPA